MLFGFQRGRTANGSIYQMRAPRHFLHQGVRSPATCRLLAPLKTKLTWIPFLSSYPHLTRFVARLLTGRPRFRLRSSVRLAVSLTIKWPAALSSSAGGPSCRRLSYRGLGPSKLELLGASHRRCNVNKRHEYCFGGRKNNKLMIGKKPSNPTGTKEENRDRKILLVVQSFKINL